MARTTREFSIVEVVWNAIKHLSCCLSEIWMWTVEMTDAKITPKEDAIVGMTKFSKKSSFISSDLGETGGGGEGDGGGGGRARHMSASASWWNLKRSARLVGRVAVHSAFLASSTAIFHSARLLEIQSGSASTRTCRPSEISNSRLADGMRE